jgi:membrane protein
MGLFGALRRAITFLTVDIWRIRLQDLTRMRAFLIGQLRIVVLSVRGFREDQCAVRASALTYYTLLALVPLAAIVIGVSRGFGYDYALQRMLIENNPAYALIASKIVEYSQALIETARGGVVAGIGLALLLWTLIKMIGNIEAAFNDIWNVGKQRGIIRKFSDYIAIVIVGTVGMVLYNSLTVFITAQIRLVLEKLSLGSLEGTVTTFVLRVLPVLLVWAVFSFIYLVMPNTRVSVRSAVASGIIAGTIYQAVQVVYIAFQIGVARYNAIYGSLAALPLFLIWIQMSWLIVLFGAEISFAIQNVHTYEWEIESLRLSWNTKKRLGLLVAHRVIRNFSAGVPPMTAAELSEELGIPVRLVRQILGELAEAGVFTRTESGDARDVAFQPACDLEHFTVKCVLDTLERIGGDTVPVHESPQFERLSAIVDSFAERIEESPENVLLKDIV